jgi:O-antigen/teichoic acid export membrane protein
VAFQTVFTQAWSISAVISFDRNDKDGFMGHIYEMFAMLMILACSAIMILNEPLSKILYAKEFYIATYYVPYLLIATLFSSLAGYFGGIFAAVKNSKICAVSTIVSALVNTVFNAIFIPAFGIAGAAVATMISYFCSWIVRVVAAKKIIKMEVDTKRLYLAFILLMGQMLCAVKSNHYYVIQTLIIVLLIWMFKTDICKGGKRAIQQFGAVLKRQHVFHKNKP